MWQDWADAQIAANLRTGEEDPVGYAAFVRAKAATTQELVARGQACYFAALHGDQLAASLGIVCCPEILGQAGLARYQSVSTAAEFRCLGLAQHLVGEAGAWAADRGATRWVICTETTNAAGRVYRRAGFTPTSQAWGADKA